MALTGTVDSPSTGADTPAEVAPYRLPTSAVAVWEPGPLDTAVHAAIRSRIEPNRGWWQFRLPPMPWQAQLAAKVYIATIGIGSVALAAVAFIGAHR